MKKLNSLFVKTFLIISVIFSAASFIFMFSIMMNQKNALYNSILSQAKTIAGSIELITADAMLTEDYSFIVEHTLKVLNANENLRYILVHKKDGISIFIDNSHWEILDKVPPNIQLLQTKKITEKIMENTLLHKHNNIFHLSYPVIFSGINWGWIDIGFSLDHFDKQMQQIYYNSVATFILIFALSILFSYFFTKWLVKPIESLSKASIKISSGDFNIHLTSDRDDEIGTLTKNFNEMVLKLKQYTGELRNSKEELEKRVEKRTKELQLLNKELDARVRKESIKRAEQERIMVQQSRHAAMGEMIGNIAHQWRQPLNALSLLLQNIENAYEMDMIDKEFIDRVVTKGNMLTQNMSKTIDDFRNFFKPNKIEEEFSFAQAYLATKDIIGSSFQNNNIELIENIDEDVKITGYSNEFSQVILNLLNNAKDILIEKNTRNRQVHIEIYQNEKEACLKLSDNAGGVPQEIIEKIFDPYFTTKEEGKGTGIGLYMSKTIIESNMHGTLDIENNDLGAVFSIHIPKKALF